MKREVLLLGDPALYEVSAAVTRGELEQLRPDIEDMFECLQDAGFGHGISAPQIGGVRVVILPQTLEDETNSRKVIDPGYAWVIPSGAGEKPVKVAFEGTTHVRERNDNDDWSRDIQVYRKVGVGVMMTNNIFSYVDTQLQGKLDVIQ